MDVTVLIPALALLTLLGVAVFALVSKWKIEARREDAAAGKSTLAADKASDGTPVDV
jgi:hypothetical protein